jgi:hypothetical protein
MKKTLYACLPLPVALPVFAPEGPQGFVGNWKSDPGTPTMTRKLELDGKVIVMTELQPGGNGGPELTIIRKYPTDGSTVNMSEGMWAGATAIGKMGQRSYRGHRHEERSEISRRRDARA